jgi:hypothetical protein
MKSRTMRIAGMAAVAMVAVFMWAGSAQATPTDPLSYGTIYLQYDSAHPPAGTAYIWSSGTGTEYVYTGVYNLKVAGPVSGWGQVLYDMAYPTPASLNPNNILGTFCIDIHQNAPSGMGLYNIYHLDNAPLYVGGAPMGSAKADDLGRLFTEVISSGVSMSVAANQTAFQAAVWEIVNETGAYNVLNGSFQAWGGSLNTTLVNGWLTGLAGKEINTNVMALVNPTTQDYALVVPGFGSTESPIPEPITMAGVLFGISGLVGYVRRRAKK